VVAFMPRKSNKDRKLSRAKRRMPPVSKAKGGLAPGMDATQLATLLQGAEDLEYVRRMKRFR
jgi:hypothetical protein